MTKNMKMAVPIRSTPETNFGVVSEVQISTTNLLNEEEKAEKKQELEQQRKHDEVMVSGEFRDHMVDGGQTTFAYRKYPGEPIRIYRLQGDRKGKLPRGVATHLKENCFQKNHVMTIEGDLQKGVHESRGKKRLDFCKD